MIQSEKKDRKMNENNEQSLKRPVGHLKPLQKQKTKKHTHNILPNSFPRGEEIEGAERIFEEIIGENVPNLMMNNNLHIYEAQYIPSRINSKRSTCRCIIVKLSKVKYKERILKAAREK